MALRSATQMIARLNVLLRDATNTTWSPTEKTECMLSAIDDDPYVGVDAIDSSTTSVSGQAIYTIPDNIVNIIELRFDLYDDGYGVALPPSWYRIIDGQIFFTSEAQDSITSGHALIFIGWQKLYSTDLFEENLQGYICHKAAVRALEMLLSQKIGLFLTNDTSTAEILNAINYHEAQSSKYLRSLPVDRQGFVL